MMRRMLLWNTFYRWKEERLFQGKLKDYLKVLGSEEKSIAYATGYCREGRYTRTLH